MNEQLSLTERGADLVKHFESCMKRVGKEDKYKAYKCPANVLTIGWGHTHNDGRKFDANSVWTLQECNDAFIEDMKQYEGAVKRLVKVPLANYQYDALVSFTYNCGEGNLAKSTLLKKVNAGDHKAAAQEFHKWNKSNGKVLKGLVRRRASESLLYQNLPDADYDGKVDSFPMPQAVDPPEGD